MVHVKVDDRAALQAFGRAVKAADPAVRKALLKRIQAATKPSKQEIKDSALRTFPSRGGLNQWVSDLGVRTQTSLTGRKVGVFIKGTLDNKRHGVNKAGGKGKRKTRKAGTFGARADVRALERGRVMHPAWGRPKAGGGLFGPQMVKAGFWSRPLEGPTTERARREIKAAMEDTADAMRRAAR